MGVTGVDIYFKFSFNEIGFKPRNYAFWKTKTFHFLYKDLVINGAKQL